MKSDYLLIDLVVFVVFARLLFALLTFIIEQAGGRDERRG